MNNYKVYQHLFPNGKSYIGITCQKLSDRWRRGNGYSEKTYVYKAIQKYGWDNIQHLVLFENLSKEEAQNKEQELIAKLETNNPNNGYNLTLGGEGVLKYDYNEIIKFWEEGMTIIEISKKCGISVSRLNRFLANIGEDRQTNKAKKLERKVNQYDLSGKYIATYDSLKKAAIATNEEGTENGIWMCCMGRMHQSGGYQWRYYEEDCNDIAPVKTRFDVMPGKAVQQYDKQGNLIAEYDKIVEAAKAIGVKPNSISKALNGYSATCKGCIWKYKPTC